jgi:hypothetical protein
VAVGERFLQRVDAPRLLDDVDRADRPPRRDVVRSLGFSADDPEVGEAEILHRPRGGSDISGFERLDEDDPDVHGGSIIAAVQSDESA